MVQIQQSTLHSVLIMVHISEQAQETDRHTTHSEPRNQANATVHLSPCQEKSFL